MLPCLTQGLWQFQDVPVPYQGSGTGLCHGVWNWNGLRPVGEAVNYSKEIGHALTDREWSDQVDTEWQRSVPLEGVE